MKSYNTTFALHFCRVFGLDSADFGRPYSRHRVLLSFPAGTQMLPFPAFPLKLSIPNGMRYPIRESSVKRLPAPPRGLSQLGTLFVGARAEPFTDRDNRR